MGRYNGMVFVSAKEIKNGAIPVESELDQTSVNPVQNGVVARAIQAINPRLDGVESAFDIATERVNLLNPEEVHEDEYGHLWSGFIPVSPGREYYFQYTVNGERRLEASDFSGDFYDVNRQKIATVNDDFFGAVIAPEGSVYAKFFLPTHEREEWAIVESSALLPYEPYIANCYSLKSECLPDGVPTEVDDKLSSTSTNPVQNKAVYSEITQLNGKFGSVNDAFCAFKSETEAHIQSLRASQVPELGDHINNLETDVDQLKQDVGTHLIPTREAVLELQNANESLEQRVGKISGNLNTSVSKITALEGKVENLQTIVAGYSSRMSGIENGISALGERMGATETAISALGVHMGDIGSALNAILALQQSKIGGGA